MTNPVTGLAGTVPPAATFATMGGTAPASATKSLDENAFLKLLVAQMKYQDPSKPMDTNQLMSQTATFTQVEKLDQLLTAQKGQVSAQQLQAASGMVGRTVAYVTTDGAIGNGVVASAAFTGSEPTLKVGDKDVPLSSVTEVRNTAG